VSRSYDESPADVGHARNVFRPLAQRAGTRFSRGTAQGHGEEDRLWVQIAWLARTGSLKCSGGLGLQVPENFFLQPFVLIQEFYDQVRSPVYHPIRQP